VEFAFAAALALLTAGTAQAQQATAPEITAKIPLAFMVSGEKMPAGTYRIDIGPGPTSPPILAIQVTSTSKDEMRFKKVLAATTPAAEVDRTRPKLVFDKVGDVYFLEKVVPSTGTVEKLPGAPGS
jgi:hypothetical protein